MKQKKRGLRDYKLKLQIRKEEYNMKQEKRELYDWKN